MTKKEIKKGGKKKPRICVVTWFHCLRNLKEVIGAYLLEGYELELITRQQGLSLLSDLDFSHIYKSIRIWETASQCEAYMKESKADIFWCHNEPDLMCEIANRPHVKRDRIVIHDCHDLPTLHPGHEKDLLPQEKICITESEHIFVPTEAYVEIIKKKYGRTKNVHVTNSCSPSIFSPDSDLPRVNGLLYCGQVNVPEMGSKLNYRNCVPLFQYLTQLGVASHIYHTTPMANLFPYTVAGASVYGVMRMYAAIHQYTRYDYGFVGSNVNCPEIQMCMPNKLWDCIMAGIPIICLNAESAGRFCEKMGIGINVQGLGNLSKVPWDDMDFWEKKRKRVREIRDEYTAEKEMRKVFDRMGI